MTSTTPRQAIEEARRIMTTPPDGELMKDAINLVRDLAALDPTDIAVHFGDDTDRDTWEMMFGHLAKGYVIGVNGVDIVCSSTTDGLDDVGFSGTTYDGDDLTPDEGVGWGWEEIERIVIY